jgi:phytoene dehydrogenase-like protein
MARKKAAVVGSGIAGSGIAALLAHSGEYEVDLYEKNGIVGGRFASYWKEGFRLDVGCHMIANCEKGTMGEILEIVGHPEAVRWHHLERGSHVFNYKGTELLFPEQVDRIGFTSDEVQRIMQFYGDTLSIPEDQYDAYDKISMIDQIEKYIRDDRARVLFGFLSGLYFVTRDSETPVGEWARCSKEMVVNRSTGYPIGGTGAIPEAYVRIMEEKGGRLHRATPIRRIVVEDRAARGVQLKSGTFREADLVISNVGLKPTVDSLVGREHYGRGFLGKVDGYEYSFCCGALKVALDQPVVGDRGLVLYIGTDDLLALEQDLALGRIPDAMEYLMVPFVSTVDPTACPEGRQLLIAGTGAGRPGDTLPRDRAKWAQAYLKGLERVFPGIGQHVLWATYTSPADIENLFGEEGNVIGIAQKIGQVGENRPPIQDPEIENLYHCSADTGVHGIGGELAADSALRLYRMLVG